MPTKASTDVIATIERQLDFDLLTLPALGANYEDAVKLALDTIARENINEVAREYKAVFRKLAMWFLFYKRDKDQSLNWLNAVLLTTPKNEVSLSHAELLNWTGYACTMDGSYVDQAPFNEAIEMYTKLRNKHNHHQRRQIVKDIELGKAFALRYKGLCEYRQNNLEKALNYLEDALGIYVVYPSEKGHFEMAETFHLLAIVRIRQGNLSTAKKLLKAAAEREKEYCDRFGDYYMKFITDQTIADLERRLYEEEPEKKELLDHAYALLQSTLSDQCRYYGTELNADVAKTLHFLGDNRFTDKSYLLALQFYTRALELKQIIYRSYDHPIVKATVDAIKKVVTNLASSIFDKIDYRYSSLANAYLSASEGNIDKAVKDFKTALNLLERDQILHDQYARTLIYYVDLLGKQKVPYENPKTIMSELKHYWDLRDDKSNPYYHLFLKAYTEFEKAYGDRWFLANNTRPKMTDEKVEQLMLTPGLKG